MRIIFFILFFKLISFHSGEFTIHSNTTEQGLQRAYVDSMKLPDLIGLIKENGSVSFLQQFSVSCRYEHLFDTQKSGVFASDNCYFIPDFPLLKIFLIVPLLRSP